MSDAIKHECGIALLRLKKPTFIIIKISMVRPYLASIRCILMMERTAQSRSRRCRVLASIKFDMEPGDRYISRGCVLVKKQPIQDIFNQISSRIQDQRLMKTLQIFNPILPPS